MTIGYCGTVKSVTIFDQTCNIFGQILLCFQFAWTLLILHISFCVVYFLLVSYDPSADAKNVDNQLGKNHKLEENLEKYPSMCQQ